MVTLLGGVAAGVINLFIPVTFVAVSRIFVATPAWNDSTAIGSPAEAQTLTTYGDEFTQMRIPSYQRIASTPMVLEPVMRELGLDTTAAQLNQQVTIRAVPDTVMLDVEVRNPSAGLAADISNAVSEQLIATIKQLEKPPFNTVSPVQPVLVSAALAPSRPVTPQVALNIGLGLAFGLVSGLTYAAFRAQRAAAPAYLEPDNLLGVAGRDEVTETGDGDGLGRDTRFLRVAVMAGLHESASGSILLVAPRSSDATFAVGMQLAEAMVEAGATAVLVSADFTLPTNVPGPGLGDVLAGTASVADVLRVDKSGNSAFMSSGSPPGSATAALASPLLRDAIAQLESRFDCVLIVGPAVLETTDAVDLAASTGTCALVCPPDATPNEVADGEQLLRSAESRYLGRIAVSLTTSSAMGER
ncbi:hypothetical protein EU78_07470 [Mycolicibacterium rufum]|nr:hypothetical protein EU78_07470 [Mycolicibacterium rufum]